MEGQLVGGILARARKLLNSADWTATSPVDGSGLQSSAVADHRQHCCQHRLPESPRPHSGQAQPSLVSDSQHTVTANSSLIVLVPFAVLGGASWGTLWIQSLALELTSSGLREAGLAHNEDRLPTRLSSSGHREPPVSRGIQAGGRATGQGCCAGNLSSSFSLLFIKVIVS